MMLHMRTLTALIGVLLLLGVGAVLPTHAQPSGQERAEYEGVEIDEKLGDTIPLDLAFRDEAGEPVALEQYFDGDRPVMLTLNYYDCPMLCPMVLDEYVRTLQGIDWAPGDQFEAVTVSIDPTETPEMAHEQKQGYVERLDKPGADQGWHFLTGNEASIDALAEAVGVNYRRMEDGEYAHPTAVIFLSGSGKVTRYIYGMDIPADDVRKALVEASDGKVGNVMDRVALYCYQFDPDANSYTADAFAIMRIGSILVLLILAGALVYFWRQERAALEQDTFDQRMEEGLDRQVAT